MTMETSTDRPLSRQLINLTINVTESKLGGQKKIGVFLLRNLTGDDRHPSHDGWVIQSDPHGTQYNYVELEAPDVGIEVTFNWTLSAPADLGPYQLYAQVLHGGQGPVNEPYTAGISFNVTESPIPELIDHNQPETVLVDEPIQIEATLKDDEEVVEAIIFFKLFSDGEYRTRPMELVSGTPQLGVWTGSLPTQSLPGELYWDIVFTDREYYITCHQPDHIIQIMGSGTPILEHEPLATAYIGQPLTIEATVINFHDNFTLHYAAGDDTEYTTMAMEVVGGTELQMNYIGHIPAQAQTGILRYYLNATNGSLLGLTPTIEVEILPYFELSPIGLSLSSSAHLHGEVLVIAQIQNNGSLDIHGLQVAFFEEYEDQASQHEQFIGYRNNLSVAAQSILEVRVWWTPQVKGDHTLRVVVDPNGRFTEIDEDNNEFNLTRSVGDKIEHAEESLANSGMFLFTMALFVMVAVVGGRRRTSRRSTLSSGPEQDRKGRC